MKEKILPVFLAAALVGSACQRPPEATPLPQQTPLAASGEPRPRRDIEAEIQRRVQATVTAQEEKPEKEWVIFKNPLGLYEIQYPESWKAEPTHAGYDVFFNPSSNRDLPVQFNVSPESINPGVNPQTYLDASIKQLNQWLIQKGHDGYSIEKIEKKLSTKIDQGRILKANQIQGSTVKYDQRIALLIAKSSLWKISFAGASPLSILDEEAFNRAIKTFVPLRSSLPEQPAQQGGKTSSH